MLEPRYVLLIGHHRGSWNDSMPDINDEPVYMAETQLQLPFPMCIGGQCSRVITVGTDGYFYLDAVRGEIKMEVFSGQGRGLYMYRRFDSKLNSSCMSC